MTKINEKLAEKEATERDRQPAEHSESLLSLF
jgi:hypothetical protein